MVSFSDSYRLWAPAELPHGVQTLIYINDELGEDVRHLFADIRLVDSLAVPMARERGTCVYLCRSPQQDIQTFWRDRIRTVRATFNR